MIPATFKAMRTYCVRDGIRSRIDEISLADLSPGDVVVRTRFAGVNYKDSLCLTGRAKVISSFPRTPGIEFVGDVAMSTVPQKVREGDAVMVHGFQTGVDFDGGFSEYVRVPVGHVHAIPNGMSAREAAILGVPGFTTAMAMERLAQLGVDPGSGPVAVTGARGAVGTLAIHLLAKAGFSVTAITRDVRRDPSPMQLGATRLLASDSLPAAPRPLEKGTFAAAIDNVGGKTLSWLIRSLLPGGSIAAVGNASGNSYDGNVLPFVLRGVQLFGIVGNAPWPQRLRLWERLNGDWKPDFAVLEPFVHTIPLERLLEHSEQQLDGVTTGRVLVSF